MSEFREAIVDEETREYRDRSSSLKFKQNLVQGLGAASVFGVIAATGTHLFKIAAGIEGATAAAPAATAVAAKVLGLTASAWAWTAIAAMVVVGIGCLYLSSKYYAESVRLDQIHQAKQIARGMSGLGQTQDVVHRPPSFPEVAAQAAQNAAAAPASLDAPMEAPLPTVTADRSLENRVVPIATAHGANVNAAGATAWEDRLAANNASVATEKARA